MSYDPLLKFLFPEGIKQHFELRSMIVDFLDEKIDDGHISWNGDNPVRRSIPDTYPPPPPIFESTTIEKPTGNTSKSKRGMSHLDSTSILSSKTRSKRQKKK